METVKITIEHTQGIEMNHKRSLALLEAIHEEIVEYSQLPCISPDKCQKLISDYKKCAKDLFRISEQSEAHSL